MSPEDYTGTISLFVGNFAPRNTYLCDGSLKNPSTDQQLFAVIGTAFGGDGRSTFGLPDFRGRTSLGAGAGPALSPRAIGQTLGAETEDVTLNAQHLPPHNHSGSFDASELTGLVASVPDFSQFEMSLTMKCNSSLGGSGPTNCFPGLNVGSAAWSNGKDSSMALNLLADTTASALEVSTRFQNSVVPVDVLETGDALPMNISNMAPFTTLNYVITALGIFPPRD